MSNRFFTADPHFCHDKILLYANRPFKTVEEMDAAIIARWNAVAQPRDRIFCLGDWCWRGHGETVGQTARRIRAQIKCQNIYLIWGNHDRKGRNDALFQQQFVKCYDSLEIEIGNMPATLYHYAQRVWNKMRYGACHLYGHSHGTLPQSDTQRAMDVGVDTNNMYLYSEADILRIMTERAWVPPKDSEVPND